MRSKIWQKTIEILSNHLNFFDEFIPTLTLHKVVHYSEKFEMWYGICNDHVIDNLLLSALMKKIF